MSAPIDQFKVKLKAVMDKAEAQSKAEITKIAAEHFGKVPLNKSQIPAYTAILKADFTTVENALLAEFKTKLKSKIKK